MSVTLTTRVPEGLAEEIEAIADEEQLDKSAVTRRLLERAVEDRRVERALSRYESGELSLEGLARAADMSIRQTIRELGERGMSFHYSEESLREDLSDA